MNKNNLSKVQQETFDPAILNDIEGYWNERSKTFSETRKKEMSGPGGAAWLKLLSEHLPTGRTLKVLDIGTGAGFFAILLAKLGHDVTGIDMSADMLHQAKLNTVALGVRAKFQKMNAQETDFDDNTFDAIISRNLTWTLPDAMEAYHEWHRILKPGGLLMNFDGDYGKDDFSHHDDKENVHANIRQELVDTCNRIKNSLRISTHRRPAWDIEVLKNLGMKVEYEEDITPIVYNDPEMHYDGIPLFAIYAVK